MLSPRTRLGRYEIRSKIGEAGMGEVYLAEDTQLHRKVALKVLPPDVAANSDRMRRFKQEAQAAGDRSRVRSFKESLGKAAQTLNS